jgi:hypothetical protein
MAEKERGERERESDSGGRGLYQTLHEPSARREEILGGKQCVAGDDDRSQS